MRYLTLPIIYCHLEKVLIKKPGISGRDISVSEFPVFAAVESVGLALAGGDNRVQAAVTQGVSVDTSSSSS